MGSEKTSEALRQFIQALRDYASVLRTTLSQVKAIAVLFEEDYAHRVESLFTEPMEELRSQITAIRDDFDRSLREDIVPSSPLYRAIPERVLPMCVLLETYVAVNGERMRLPPDVMEGIIPMVGRGERVFYREMTHEEMRGKFANCWDMAIHKERNFPLSRTLTDAYVSSILRQYNWCVIFNPSGGLSGSAHFYSDSGDERFLLFDRYYGYGNGRLTVAMYRADEASIIPIVENVLQEIGLNQLGDVETHFTEDGSGDIGQSI